MPAVEKITIALTPDLAATVQEAVKSGGYASTSEVIREALRDWREKRREREGRLNEIRRFIDEGIQSGISPRKIEDLIQDLEHECGMEHEEV